MHNLIGFTLGNAQRRRKPQNVTLRHGTGNNAFFQQIRRQSRADFFRRIKELPLVPIFHKLDGNQESFASHLPQMG